MTGKYSKSEKESNVAIKVENLSKSFRVPHQKIDSVRGAFVNLFTKKSYDDFKALDRVSFKVRKGEFIGILGHNGSGKSTLLKCLAQVYSPDRGSIVIDGEVSPFLELGIGFNPELSGRDNIYLNATILGLSTKDIDRKFNAIVAFSEVGEFIDQQVKNYSSGMKSRLAFSVSVHANRDILLMDEVLAVGDSRFQKKCLDHFETYKKSGKTVILVTHNTAVVRDHCDRAILLNRGSVELVGSPNEVSDRYVEINLTPEERFVKQARQESLEAEKKEYKVSQKSREIKKVNEETIKPKKLQKKKFSKKIVKQAVKKDVYTGKVLISNIALFNSKNLHCTDFKSGDDIRIDITLDKNFTIDMSIGVVILDSAGTRICGANTFIDFCELRSLRRKKSVKVVFQDTYFLTGKYFLRVGVFNKEGTETHDFSDRKVVFDYSSSDRNTGVVSMRHEWA